MKNYQCPYDDMGCIYLDTAGMFKCRECYDCEHYGDGIRPTSANPVLAWILKKFGYKPKKEFKPTDDDIMMGL